MQAVEIAVLALETDPAARSRIAAECVDVVATDGVDAIVLGCAGVADPAAELTVRVGVPVIDGVAAAVAAVEGLVRLGSPAASAASPLPCRSPTPARCRASASRRPSRAADPAAQESVDQTSARVTVVS